MPYTAAHRNIYRNKRQEEEIWEPAKERWGGSYSSLVNKLLEEYVEEHPQGGEDATDGNQTGPRSFSGS